MSVSFGVPCWSVLGGYPGSGRGGRGAGTVSVIMECRSPVKTRRVCACSCVFFHAHRAGPVDGRGRTVRLPGSGARPARRPCPPLPVVRPVAKAATSVHPASPRPAVVSWSSSTATPWAGRRTRSSPPAPPGRPGLRAITADGKAPRGAHTNVTGHVTLLAAMDRTGHIPARRQATDKSNEIPAPGPCWTASA